MEFCTLFSGSSGNASYIADEKTKILIDAGVSMKALGQALACAGTALGEICAVLITHEHSDHVKGLGAVTRKYKLPVYANRATAAKLIQEGGITQERIRIFENGEEFSLGTLRIRPFKTPHDSVDSVGYRVFESTGISVAVATDMGHISQEILEPVLGAELVLLEANHDENMVYGGRYPYFLKKRILSDYGHLSNLNCAKAIKLLAEHGTRKVILGHLSQENNFPALAYETAAGYLKEQGISLEEELELEVAPRNGPGEINRLTELRQKMSDSPIAAEGGL